MRCCGYEFSWEMYTTKDEDSILYVHLQQKPEDDKQKNNCTVKHSYFFEKKKEVTLYHKRLIAIANDCIQEYNIQNKSQVSVAQLLYCTIIVVQGIWNEIWPKFDQRSNWGAFVFSAHSLRWSFFLALYFPWIASETATAKATAMKKRHQANIWIMLINILIF